MSGGDVFAWACVLGALAATLGALAAGRRGCFLLAVLLLAVAGVALRGNLAHRYWLSSWDERYHAVVGRNLVDHPGLPTLVDRPLYEVPPKNWFNTRIWLHKPPLSLWMIAGSLRTFGENEQAVRIPSLVFSFLGILLTFLIGRRLLGAPAGLMAAGLHAWNGRLAQIAGGTRATDHVDHQFTVLVALGVWLALLAGDELARAPRRLRGWGLTGLCGVAIGLALLTKSFPALVIVGVLGLALLATPLPWVVRLGAPALAGAIGLLVRLPWARYTSREFPEQAAFYSERSLRYFTEVVEGHAGPPWFYLSDMADEFGLLTPVAVLLFLVYARMRRELWPVAGWLLATYGIFSLSPTKMTGYVLIAAPAVFLSVAWLWKDAWWEERLVGGRRTAQRVLAVAVLVAFVFGAAWGTHRPWRSPQRRMLWAEELRFMGEQIEALPPGPWVVFNVPNRQHGRFYTRATLYRGVPEAGDLERARELGMRVAFYGDPSDRRPAPPGVTLLPSDPRTLEQRAILAQLPPRESGIGTWLWNAEDRQALEDYIERLNPVRVRERLPDETDVAEVSRKGGRHAILLKPGAPDPPVPEGLVWTRVESERYAR